MNRLLPLALILCAVPFVTAQKRANVDEPADFDKVVAEATRHWQAENYGKCTDALQRASQLAGEKRSAQLVAALPAAPPGFEKKPQKKQDQAANNAMGAMLLGTIGSVTNQRYEAVEGRGNVDVTLSANSPLVSMMGMMFSNPAMLDEGSELIEYGPNKAILTTKGERLELKILLEGKHLCDVQSNGLSEDALFAMFDQAAVDRLIAALNR